MTVPVIHALQVVDVDHQERGVGLVAHRTRQFPFRSLEEASPVERTRQIVRLCEQRQARADARVVEHEGDRIGEPGDELELDIAELEVVGLTVDAERSCDTPVRHQRHPQWIVTPLASLEHRRELVFGLVPLEHDKTGARNELLDCIGERSEERFRCLLPEQAHEDVRHPLVGAKFDRVVLPYLLCLVHMAAVARLPREGHASTPFPLRIISAAEALRNHLS